MSGESGGTSRLNVAYNIHCDLVAEREVSVVVNIITLVFSYSVNSYIVP